MTDGSAQDSPSGSTLSSFNKALDVVTALLDKRQASVRLLSPIHAKLLLDTRHVEAALVHETLDVKEFRSIVDNEISPVLAAVLSEDEDLFVESGEPDDYGTGLSSDETDRRLADYRRVMAEKLSAVRERLATEEIRSRYHLKQTTKAQLLGPVRWHINVRQQDSERLTSATMRSATVQLVLYQPTHPDDASSFHFNPHVDMTVPTYVTFVCDASDLDDLIAELTRAKSALA